MELKSANTADASSEKHVPVIEKTESGYLVRIGSEKHPMIPEHYIEWIELIADDRIYRRELKAGDQPEAEFCVSTLGEGAEARAYCNLHALWSAKL
jgi:superoxide reductase